MYGYIQHLALTSCTAPAQFLNGFTKQGTRMWQPLPNGRSGCHLQPPSPVRPHVFLRGNFGPTPYHPKEHAITDTHLL
ncbi:hypothetical protein JMJ77_0003999 [Colletotrichum scovillei]|uniref:Uncharacterized protein n=1 Tax=Colletotrichum scovillei TaxID=1209932 RepID=A0A9P7QWM0_9PEZI|nr:hypothetical protein JMJ77_0003999 [Colletotrichum scovillei]KAG7049247.1 hypothetical protein JMJ78_0013230 [Colletotrichum scovillei]KAG7063988.1 hypothetical protein JMJ76_0007036 [Colletotrichum scovillei]